ncbi:MAG TPA: MtrB/PioB family outer membrane beta-barrel protein [Thermodesulfobacteriota bacterium]|nr:MtrB/PioB family outer membrane beta-barrel protein [Thermodesulfobacteriota bacterium]
MKAKIMVMAMILSLVPFSSAFPLEDTIEGEVSVEGIGTDVNGGEGGRAKFTEYKDLKEHGGAYGRARLNLDTDKFFFNLNAGDFAYDTQYYNVEGGMWGKFKFDAFYDQIPHNLTFDARTYFQGAGHYSLTGVPNTNFGLWNTFDYTIDRKQYGGGFKLDMLKPFFFNVSFQREDRDGIKPAGVAPGSPGDFALELPEPIHYTTNNLKVEAGYGKKPLFLSLGFIYSNFSDAQDKLNFTNPFDPFPTDTLTLPPDNQYYKGFFKGDVQLPLNTRFNVNLGYSSARSDASLLNSFVDGGAITNLALSNTSFDGRIDTQSASFVLTSHPLRFLNAKIFYSYYNTENKNRVVFQDDLSGALVEFNKPFEYQKNSAGIDLGLKLPVSFYLSGGYKYIQTDRKVKGLEFLEIDPTELAAELEVIPPNNKDHIGFVDLKWSGLDFLAVKAGYQRLYRSADFQSAVTPTNRRFAYAAQDQSTYRASVDIFPIENLNFSFQYQYKITDYKEDFGLKKDKRDQFDISADYMIGKIAKLYAFSDIEYIRLSQPEQNQTPVLAEWSADQKDKSWGYGVGAEVYAIPQKLTFIFQHNYVRSNGGVDFTLSPQLFGPGTAGNVGLVGANNDIIDIIKWDDYTLYSFKVKAVYNFTKCLSASLGYAYQRFRYSDAQLDNYNFTPNGAATNRAFLTGAYKDQSYSANSVFGGLTFRF